jgi:hypothetical protein
MKPKTMGPDLNGMFSNSRGLGDLVKHLRIAHCIRDHNLEFVAISKTIEEISLIVYLIVYQMV